MFPQFFVKTFVAIKQLYMYAGICNDNENSLYVIVT